MRLIIENGGIDRKLSRPETNCSIDRCNCKGEVGLASSRAEAVDSTHFFPPFLFFLFLSFVRWLVFFFYNPSIQHSFRFLSIGLRRVSFNWKIKSRSMAPTPSTIQIGKPSIVQSVCLSTVYWVVLSLLVDLYTRSCTCTFVISKRAKGGNGGEGKEGDEGGDHLCGMVPFSHDTTGPPTHSREQSLNIPHGRLPACPSTSLSVSACKSLGDPSSHLNKTEIGSLVSYHRVECVTKDWSGHR